MDVMRTDDPEGLAACACTKTAVLYASRCQADIEKQKMEKEIEESGYKIEQLKKCGREEYIRYRMGELKEYVLMEKAEMWKKDIKKLQDRQKILSGRLAEMDDRTEKRNHYLRTLMKCKKETPFTAEVLHVLIDKIEVFPDKRVLLHFAYSGKEISGLGGGVRL